MNDVKRKYVMVSNKQTEPILFWGRYSEDNEKRRIGSGYTTDINSCEKMSLKEIEECSYENPIMIDLKELLRVGGEEDFFIKISDLEKSTYHKKTYYFK